MTLQIIPTTEWTYCEGCKSVPTHIYEEVCPRGAEEHWTCGECGEIRFDDARVEGGLKCSQCAYGG